MPQESLRAESLQIVLINPPAYGHFSEKHFERPEHPRISIAYLSSYLKKEKISCQVIDGKFTGLNFDSIIKRLSDLEPEFVGVTAMTPEILDAAYLAGLIKKQLPRIKIVIGGPHVTALPSQTLEEFPVFDFAIVGEGEIALSDLIVKVSKGRRIDGINGIVFRDNGKIRINAAFEKIDELDKIPFPDWESFPLAQAYPILATRGCPYQCNFCMRVSGNKLRRRSPENVIKEIQFVIDTFKPNKLTFHDETFGLGNEWTHRLLDLMIENDIHRKIRWEATSRVDLADFRLYKKMKRANCSFLGFGIESGNEKILKQTRKNITLEQTKKAVAMAKKARLVTGGMFIIGHPYETDETINDTINFAAKLPVNAIACGIMVPYPGTEIAKMVGEGKGNYRVLSTDWKDFNKQVGNALELENIPRKKLEYYQLKLYIKFYLLHFRFRKIKALADFLRFKNILSGAVFLFHNFYKRIFKKTH